MIRKRASNRINKLGCTKKITGNFLFVVQYAPRVVVAPQNIAAINAICKGVSTQRSLRLRASLPGFLTLVKRRVTVSSTRYYAVMTSIKTVTIDANLKKTSIQKST